MVRPTLPTPNQNGFAPNQINPNMRTHESQMVRPTLPTPNHNNHAGLSSLPSGLASFYHGPPASSSSSRFNQSRVVPYHQMRSNMVSPAGFTYRQPQFSGYVNSQFPPAVLTTQAVPNRLHVSASTNMVTNQNVRERGDRVVNSILHQLIPPQALDHAALLPEEIEEPFHQYSDPFSMSPTNSQDHVSQDGRPKKKIRTEAEFFEAINDFFDNQEAERSEEDENGDWHTCPKCECIFDTSQILGAHTRLVHGREESNEERKKRLSGKGKIPYPKQNHPEVHSKSLEIKPDEEVAKKAEATE
ncbi:unnamed protein product [Microthlaspi erraticum]|uniref:C2H2-type domain-containing protein n=1 Tax=Microthlaspi erraticum TaxID=1685480 RepID=A0A6D2L1B5_9BRAS|nr:unnamed protein product [Microthlaspi erraticum]